VPEVLLEQLAPGGRLVIPVGSSGIQNLIRVTRTQAGFEQEDLCRVSFVPMLPDKQ
jgi:protein-L-isoaspartate(D-aspartate) O-methyltransferase